MRTRSPFGLAAILLVFAQATFAPRARADDDDVTALLLRGFELRRQHRNEEALAAYEQAFALSPTPAVRAQRALAEQTLGHWVVAEGDSTSPSRLTTPGSPGTARRSRTRAPSSAGIWPG